MRRLVCLVRGGHRWRTSWDAAGSITSCARCGTVRHLRTDSVRDASFKVHTDLAADFSSRRPSHGPENIDADDRDSPA